MAVSVIPQTKVVQLHRIRRPPCSTPGSPDRRNNLMCFNSCHCPPRVSVSRKVSFQTQKPSQNIRYYIWHKLDVSSLHVSEQQETHQEGTVYNTGIPA